MCVFHGKFHDFIFRKSKRTHKGEEFRCQVARYPTVFVFELLF